MYTSFDNLSTKEISTGWQVSRAEQAACPSVGSALGLTMRTFGLLSSLLIICTLLSGHAWRAGASEDEGKRSEFITAQPVPRSVLTSAEQYTLSEVANDMQGDNEGHPHGVPPSYSFYSRPVLNNGNNTTNENGTNHAFTVWGTIYVDATGNPARNTRVAIRSCRAAWKRASSGAWRWQMVPRNALDASDYPENFQGKPSVSDSRLEPDGSTSYLPQVGRTTHFFGPYPRIPIVAGDVGGIIAVCEAKLVVDNREGIDDRSVARFLVNVGADYYVSDSGGGVYNNPSIAGGKFKFARSEWRAFGMTTLPYDDLLRDPPPTAILSGIVR